MVPRSLSMACCVSLLALAAACTAAPETGARGAEEPRGPEGWRTISSVEPWEFEVPPSWRVQPFRERGLYTFFGALISNTGQRFRHPRVKGGSTSSWDFRSFPDDGVLVQFAYGARLNMCHTPDTSFPLSLDDAERLPGRPKAGEPSRLTVPIVVDGVPHWSAWVWFGGEASEADREAAADLVSSIRPTGPVRGCSVPA